MKLKNRIAKLEVMKPQKTRLLLIRYQSELVELICEEEAFKRLENESEDNFILRVSRCVLNNDSCRGLKILVGNF